MGIQIKFNFNDAKDELNVVVQNIQGGKRKTLLDVLVPLVTPTGDHVSDIDDCTNEDLLVHRSQNKRTWNSLNDDLEKALGEELGIEVNNITGNVTPRRVDDPGQLMSPVSAATSMVRKCQLSESEEEEILSTEAGEDEILESANQVEDSMVDTNETDEKLISDTIENRENIDTDATENITVSPKDCSRNENHSIPCEDHSIPSTSASNKKDVPDHSNAKSSPNDINSRSKSKEREGTPQSDSCEFIIEEVMDLDCIEEIEGWSNDGEANDKCGEQDGSSFVDLTADRENRDPRLKKQSISSVISTTDAESCCEQERVVTLHDYSDDDDEVGSQYSSARRSPRLRVRSDASRASFDTDFHDSRRAVSNPPEDLIETIYDDYELDECKYVPQVVDLTSDRDIECVDLTRDKRFGPSPLTTNEPQILRRSEQEVMDNLKNFYESNKNAIAENKEALRAFGLSYNKKVNCAAAPPKGGNGLFGKRSASDCDGVEIKFSRLQPRGGGGGSVCRVGSGPWSGLRERDVNARSRPSAAVRPLNEKPKQTCGPAGYRLDDDLDPPKAPSSSCAEEDEEDSYEDDSYGDDWHAEPRAYHYRGGRHRAFYAPWQRTQQRRGRSFGHFHTRRFPRKHPSPLTRRHTGNAGRTLRPTRQRGKGVWVQ